MRRVTIFVIIVLAITATVALAVKPKIFFDNENKQFAMKETDCKYADFSTLNSIIRPLGFIAGPGGGYVFQDKKYYCNPCIIRADKTVTIDGNLFEIYKPVEPYVYKFAKGVSYEWCQISQ